MITPDAAKVTHVAQSALESWSAIQKVLRQAQSNWAADWRRQADVYASGLLDTLPPGIRAPRVHAIASTSLTKR